MHRTNVYIIGLLMVVMGMMPALGLATAGETHGTAHGTMDKKNATQSDHPPARPGSRTSAADATAEGKTVTEASGPKAQKAVPPADPNRRWIMKQKDHTGQRIKPQKPIPLKWENPSQQKQCRAYDEALARSFDKAQFYSIQGDRCKTAQYGRDFLNTAERSRRLCPDKFLEANGITPLMVRNMKQLEALGQESCLGTAKAKPAKAAAKKQAPVKPTKKN